MHLQLWLFQQASPFLPLLHQGCKYHIISCSYATNMSVANAIIRACLICLISLLCSAVDTPQGPSFQMQQEKSFSFSNLAKFTDELHMFNPLKHRLATFFTTEFRNQPYVKCFICPVVKILTNIKKIPFFNKLLTISCE